MYDIITLTLPADEYITNVSYGMDHSLYVNSGYITDNVKESQAIVYGQNTLMLPNCDERHQGVLMNKIEIDNKDHTIKMELQAKGKVQSEVIKKGAAKCGFKVE